MQSPVILTFVIAYLVLMVVIGTLYGRKVKNNDDFMVAGRSLSQLILTGTLLATWTGAGTIIGRANFSYTYGPLASIFYSAGAPIGILIMYFFLAQRIRGLAKYTVPEIMELRYGSEVRVLTAVAILFAYTAIISEQIRGLGYVLNLTTGMSAGLGSILGLVAIIFLAFIGGLISVAYTDAISAVLIAGGLLGSFVFVFLTIGGFGGLVADLPETKTTLSGGLTFMQTLGFMLPTLFLFLGDQNMYQRFGAATDPQTAKKSALGFFFGDVLFYFLVAFLASSAAVLLPNIAADTAVLRLASDVLPVVLGAMVLTAATAFIITTGNSFVLSLAGNVVYDLYAKLSGRQLSQSQYLTLTRVAVVAIGGFAYLTGQFFPSVLEIQVYSYTMYGAVVTPSLLAVFLWRRASTAGAMASIVTGIVATLTWEFVLDKPLDWNSILFSLPLSVLMLVFVSLLTTPRSLSAEERNAAATG